MRNHGENSANILQAQRPLLGEHLPQLLEYPIGLIDLFLGAIDVHEFPAGHNADPERLANHAQMLIAAAEEQERFIAVIQRQGHGSLGAHRFLNKP